MTHIEKINEVRRILHENHFNTEVILGEHILVKKILGEVAVKIIIRDIYDPGNLPHFAITFYDYLNPDIYKTILVREIGNTIEFIQKLTV